MSNSNKVTSEEVNVKRSSKNANLQNNVISMETKENNPALTPEYNDILLFAIEREICQVSTDDSMNDFIVNNAIRQSLKEFVIAGQAGNILPQKLKQMIISGLEPEHRYSNWQSGAALEQQSGMLVGVASR